MSEDNKASDDQENDFIKFSDLDKVVKESFKLPDDTRPDDYLKVKHKDLIKYTRFLTNTLRKAMDKQCDERRQKDSMIINMN